MSLLLVTGGTGFVMSHVVRAWLESDPEARALVVDAAAPVEKVARYFAPFADRLTVATADLCDDAALAALPEAAAVTHVVHGAAVTSINRMTQRDGARPSLAGALPALETNLMGTARVLAWANDLSDLRRYIQVSTGSVYGPSGPAVPGQPLPEEGYIDPDGLYGITKYAAEQLALQCGRQFGLPVAAVRFSSVYGPMDRETAARQVALAPGVVATKALRGEVIRIEAAEAVGDYIHADCLARAVCCLLRAEAPRHEVYNVALGEAVTLAKLVALAAERCPGAGYEIAGREAADIRAQAGRTGGRWGGYDISRLREEFGWQPRPLREALHSYIDWLAAEGVGGGPEARP